MIPGRVGGSGRAVGRGIRGTGRGGVGDQRQVLVCEQDQVARPWPPAARADGAVTDVGIEQADRGASKPLEVTIERVVTLVVR
ncbi:hypothetical protein CcI156_18375 [Frankia sp. CcI156]|uniref:Uncharacterized protein n=1 Tax=Frankia casuarinae (strain DSM 45818 / CECT 9043 / HFP020203 / CcI3) TaxID=106370 RepID=Q2JBY2_FRACC|nr:MULTISPECIES: hypothetical protein [Frankia]ABD11210.1 hypothetical protein Francci3_1834 [Frankia casuarinae]ESZ99694.1 hypothetical protein CcI6DRAFT_04898 [Frankia sp. CcI6]EYT90444.1 hypothetical protein ThrDRAFT_03903 [Frankia casuarinae]OAA19302.1 hypothetical protein AAY23_110924 [Frankia casuarinae]OFB42818.1 hypothetical protein Manayef4_14155 [Frankia sp. CgIM4]